jgi:hypothetical protein
MSKSRKTVIPYSEEALKFFQEENDKTEFTAELVDTSYMSYLLGDNLDLMDNSTNDVAEFEDSDDEWYMD